MTDSLGCSVCHSPLEAAADCPAAGGEAGRTGRPRTQGAWEPLGRECRPTVVSLGMGDSSALAQRWEQVWEGGLGAVEASVGPAGLCSLGALSPDTSPQPRPFLEPVRSLSLSSGRGQ